MKNSGFVITGFVCIVAASFAFITTDVPRYKNLKILNKNISKEELDSVMDFFSMSLGQKCNFCHVGNEAEKTMDFASDANPNKPIARKMMLMAAKINRQYFNYKEQNKTETIQSVTCYTCHHGKPHPDIKSDTLLLKENSRKFPGDSAEKRAITNFAGDSSINNMKNMPRDSMKNFKKDTSKSRHQ